MEIPKIGRLFRGKTRPTHEEDDPITEIEQPAPRVDRETVMNRIRTSPASPVSPEEISEATPGSLEDLLRDRLTYEEGRKFLREGDRVVIGGVGAHVAYARAAGIIPEDAGSITRDAPNSQALVIKDGSFGLGIPPNNANRPITLKILSEMAPNIVFKAG